MYACAGRGRWPTAGSTARTAATLRSGRRPATRRYRAGTRGTRSSARGCGRRRRRSGSRAAVGSAPPAGFPWRATSLHRDQVLVPGEEAGVVAAEPPDGSRPHLRAVVAAVGLLAAHDVRVDVLGAADHLRLDLDVRALLEGERLDGG